MKVKVVYATSTIVEVDDKYLKLTDENWCDDYFFEKTKKLRNELEREVYTYLTKHNISTKDELAADDIYAILTEDDDPIYEL